MEDTIQKIDIEKIMDEIRQEIQTRGYTDDNIDFQNISQNITAVAGVKTYFDENEFEQALVSASNQHKNEYYRMIPKGGLKSVIQRTIRKMVKFMMVPMIDQQNQYNYQMVICMRQMEAFVKAQQEQMEIKDQQIEELEEKILQLSEGNKAAGNREV